jgi:hypothetical protein
VALDAADHLATEVAGGDLEEADGLAHAEVSSVCCWAVPAGG